MNIEKNYGILDTSGALKPQQSELQLKVAKNLNQFDKAQLMKLSTKYGRVVPPKIFANSSWGLKNVSIFLYQSNICVRVYLI